MDLEKIMAFCVNCGEKLPDKAKFCPACGTAVECQKNSTSGEKSLAEQFTENQKEQMKQAKDSISKNFDLIKKEFKKSSDDIKKSWKDMWQK
jgi:uncharacterized membrane protein YvbJ